MHPLRLAAIAAQSHGVNAPDKKTLNVIKAGKVEECDITVLSCALLNCNLHEAVKRHIKHFCNIRNEFYGHACDMQLKTEVFNSISKELKCIVKQLFGEEAKNEIHNIITSPLTEAELEQRKNFIKVTKMLLVPMSKHLRKLVAKWMPSCNTDQLDIQALSKIMRKFKYKDPEEKCLTKRLLRRLRNKRNQYSHSCSIHLTDVEFKSKVTTLKDIAKKLFCKDAPKKLDAIINC